MDATKDPNPSDEKSGGTSTDPQEEKDTTTTTTTTTTSSSSKVEKSQSGAWIRYRIEYRHRETNELIHWSTKADEDFFVHIQGQDQTRGADSPAFELIAVYKTRPVGSNVSQPAVPGAKEAAPPPTSMAPSYQLHIYSFAIINALQSVVQYYPGQELTGDDIVVHWPYPILVHHYDELSKFRENCVAKDPAALCVREKDAYEHLGLLLQFLDQHVMEEIKAEKERNRNGFVTFEGMWVALKPGVTVLSRMVETQDWVPGVVHSISGGIFENPPVKWSVNKWSMQYNGEYVGRKLDLANFEKFDGEGEMTGASIVIDPDDDEAMKKDERVMKLIKHGEMYWKLLRKQCRYYKGKTREFPYNVIDSHVMADLDSFYTENNYRKPELMDTSDCRNWTSDCTCTVCKENKTVGNKKIEPLFNDYNFITLEHWDELTDHQYILCPNEMHSFVFRTRTWEKLHVGHFIEPKFDRQMIDNLVMDETRVRTLKALAKSFARVNKDEKPIDREFWAADFVKGKGNGLVFLLHGRPGVGKTCTAECIAEFTRSPLMVLTSSDIGTKPDEVEWRLTRSFKTAKSWGAVLLIDEADVFMERRTTADLTRNSLVAGFLRALEFYDGILFLTTNRVGSFDDAFISRVHIQLYYPDFTDEQRERVWKTFADKLVRERGHYLRLNIDAKEYLRGAEMRAVKWNGREIRNAFQTAVALAEYDAEKDEEGKILLTDSHLRAVVELSRDFKDYLNDLHKGDEGKRAERKYDRLDSFSKGETLN